MSVATSKGNQQIDEAMLSFIIRLISDKYRACFAANYRVLTQFLEGLERKLENELWPCYERGLLILLIGLLIVYIVS